MNNPYIKDYTSVYWSFKIDEIHAPFRVPNFIAGKIHLLYLVAFVKVHHLRTNMLLHVVIGDICFVHRCIDVMIYHTVVIS